MTKRDHVYTQTELCEDILHTLTATQIEVADAIAAVDRAAISEVLKHLGAIARNWAALAHDAGVPTFLLTPRGGQGVDDDELPGDGEHPDPTGELVVAAGGKVTRASPALLRQEAADLDAQRNIAEDRYPDEIPPSKYNRIAERRVAS